MAYVAHQSIQWGPRAFRDGWSMVMSITHPRLRLDLMDRPVGGGMSAQHICHDLHGKLRPAVFGWKVTRHISAQRVNIRLIDRAPQGAIFLQRLHGLAHELLEQTNGFFPLPAVRLEEPQRVRE